VRWGEETTDEMCIGFVDIAPQAEVANESELRVPNQLDVVRYLIEGQSGGTEAGSPLKRLSDRFLGRGEQKK
jgi:hypothetical protein